VPRTGRPVKFSFDDSYIPEPNSGCWLWIGKVNHLGYGALWIRDSAKKTGWRSISAHRHSYETNIGPIPDGLSLDHKCRVRCCVNPAHLEPVTHAENVRRGISGEVNGARMRAKTHCPSGHPYSAENTRFNENNHRACRQCDREKAAKKRANAGVKYTHLSSAQRSEMLNQFANGKTTKELARYFGVDISTIQKWIRRSKDG
jgi:DNA-binding CsgD family transcriptional regulator